MVGGCGGPALEGEGLWPRLMVTLIAGILIFMEKLIWATRLIQRVLILVYLEVPMFLKLVGLLMDSCQNFIAWKKQV